MANEITSIMPTILAATNKVVREMVGFLPSVTLNAEAKRLAVGQTITSHVAPARPARDVTPAATRPSPTAASYVTRTFTLSKARAVDVTWSGREQITLDTQGRPVNTILRDDFAQAFRTLTNEVEVDIATAVYKGASRAIGSAGTTPYTSDLTAASYLEQVLNDNGAPGDRVKVMNSDAVVKLRGRAALNDPNQAVQDFLQQGTLINLAGISHKFSPGVQTHTKGTGTGYVTDTGETYAVGTTTIHVDTGTGTLVAGDVVTFAGDSNKYVVKTGFAGNGDMDLVIAAPGLRQTLADGVAMTIGNNYVGNVAFSRQAVELATRLPETPEKGDLATDSTEVLDSHSGLIFEVRYYPGYRQGSYEVGLAWGINVAMPEWVAISMG